MYKTNLAHTRLLAGHRFSQSIGRMRKNIHKAVTDGDGDNLVYWATNDDVITLNSFSGNN